MGVRRVTLVCGPPCAGKTTWVDSVAQPGDLVLDRDLIARELGSSNKWRHTSRYVDLSEQAMQERMWTLATLEDVSAYVIRSAPGAHYRNTLARQIRATDVRVIDPGLVECTRRARAAHRPRDTVRWIHQWYMRDQEVTDHGGTSP